MATPPVHNAAEDPVATAFLSNSSQGLEWSASVALKSWNKDGTSRAHFLAGNHFDMSGEFRSSARKVFGDLRRLALCILALCYARGAGAPGFQTLELALPPQHARDSNGTSSWFRRSKTCFTAASAPAAGRGRALRRWERPLLRRVRFRKWRCWHPR